jgi:hypothetical protein
MHPSHVYMQRRGSRRPVRITSIIDRAPGRGKHVTTKSDIRSNRIVLMHSSQCCLGDDVNCDVHGY